MHLSLTLARPERAAVDLEVTVEAYATVGELAQVLLERDPDPRPAVEEPTLSVGGVPLPRALTVLDSRLQNGAHVEVVSAAAGAAGAPGRTAAAVLVVVAGPGAGSEHRLQPGVLHLGRDPRNDVVLPDPQVSGVHARLSVGDVVEITDLASSNGVVVGGELVPRAVLRDDDVVELGDTRVRVVRLGAVTRDASGKGELFNRSPRLDSRYEGIEVEAPEPPNPPERAALSLIPLLMPLVMGAVLYAVTQRIASVLFVALSPLLMLGQVWERRRTAAAQHRQQTAQYREDLDGVREELAASRAREVAARRAEHPSVAALAQAASTREPLLWSARPDRRGFLELRLGTGRQTARDRLVLPRRASADRALWAELQRLAAEVADVEDVPVVARLADVGNVGVAGPRPTALPVAQALVAQVACLHSPAEVVLAAVVPSSATADWQWLKWLPHVHSEHSPLSGDHLATGPGAVARVLSQVEELVVARTSGEAARLPAVVLVVDDGAEAERSRLVALAEAGPQVGVHVLWTAPSLGQLPAACRAYVDTAGTPAVGFVPDGLRVEGVRLEWLTPTALDDTARALAPLVDAGAPVEDQSDLPRSVSLVSLFGDGAMTGPSAVLDRWRTGGSLPGSPRPKRDAGLRAVVGAGAGHPFVLDLREHGPHALVGGTTGSGKSEFLQSWVLAMAMEHSPSRVTFLFVDYKGESAFGECVSLPHSVGLVSDLNPHLVRRALTSLRAELRHREEVLRERKAKDLLELERRGDPAAPPSLVIVVDEFAALVKEVPDFVDGVVDVAQRGRSLGLHLVLATQRPAGVIRDSLRANTNLRIALRMADEDDSQDVLGSTAAAAFDPSLPGRAMAKLGPSRLTSFQSGYVGGHTSDTPPPSQITVVEQPFGPGAVWEAPAPVEPVVEEQPEGPTDLARVVTLLRDAHAASGTPAPRRPWLDELATAYDLVDLPHPEGPGIVFGLQDEPGLQRQTPVAFWPDRDGTMAVYGTSGSGKSAFLRSLAVAAGLPERDDPCHVYGLDFAGRGLSPLAELPHVGAVVQGDDDERVARLLRMLRGLVDERAGRYAAVRASTVTQYRELTGQRDPRVLLLVDGLGAFRSAYEVGPHARLFDVFQSLATDGREVGVHVVLAADRSNAVPGSLASLVQRRLVLRLSGDGHESALLKVPDSAFDETTPPGRGFLDGTEVQVAVLGGSPSTVREGEAVTTLAERLRREHPWAEQPQRVERLPERVLLSQLPPLVDGLPALGLSDEHLGPIGFAADGPFLVVGTPGSGRTTLLAALAHSVLRAGVGGPLVLLTPSPSALSSLAPWHETAHSHEDVALLAKQLVSGSALWSAGRSPTLFLENLPEFLNGAADSALQQLVKAVKAAGGLVVADGETASMASSYPLVQIVRSARHGIALVPDQTDGDLVFKTSFPRLQRASFPAGRGLYVRGGRVVRVQCALPDTAS